jgi:hypothetical protein
MHTRIVEFTNGFNWGKFLVGRFDGAEWMREAMVRDETSPTRQPLLRQIGWDDRRCILVLDLQTGEGAIFTPPGNARADLEKHKIWVCPMFEVFLGWLYRHPEHCQDIESIPALIEATDPETMAASAMYGHRRPGPQGESK